VFQRNNSKIQSVLLSFIILVLCFSGCTRKPDPQANRIVISLPQWFYPSEERPWLQGVWEGLRRAHPDTSLELQLSPGRTEQVLQKLLVAQAAGDGPDLACIRMHWAGELLRHRILVPLKGCVPEAVWREMVPSLGSVADRGGVRFLLPYDAGVRVILYRADLFREAGIPEPGPGWKREDLIQAARALTRDLDNDGTVDRWGFGLPGARHEKTIFQWLPWFWSLGGHFGEGSDEPPQLRSPASIGAMQWYRDLARVYRVTPPTCYSMDQAAVFQGLAGGLFAMTEGGSWEPALLKEYSRHPDRVRIAILPSMLPGKPSVTLVDGWGFGLLTRDPEKKRIIGHILTALSSPEHQLEKYKAGRMLSPFRALYRDPLFRADPAAGALAEAVHGGKPVPDFPWFPLVQEALEISLQEVLMNDEDPGTVLSAQQEKMRAGFRRIRDRWAGQAGGGSGTPTGPDPAGDGASSGPAHPSQGSLRVVFPGEGRERLLSPEDLLGMERTPVGDLELIPLASLVPGSVTGDLVVRAADGFEKRVPAQGLESAFFDPESLYVYLVRVPGAKTFTIRDVTQLTLEEPTDPGGLVIVAGKDRRAFPEHRLREMAHGGVLPFGALLKEKAPDLPAGGKVRLIARDGYGREVALEDFRKGRLHLEGMRCEFPDLPTRDQVSGLKGIEIR